ncbi:hypothetical protein [Algoriphagus hitonicola]|uniref:Uncharacterized protein n=1 Tax=Algoriphagus hitonicola TaxID=435880 RepID=A0A1I2S015_9BACT|nr:hypothetical protein [Algoriphagus hitonicola]SFG46275.1 hypothetical protein SAMN04487988_10465 [Algoriphagus hitonicola]
MKKSFNLFFVLGLFTLIISSCGSDPTDELPEPDLSVIDDDVQINRTFEDLDNYTLTVLEENGLGARIFKSQLDEICEGVDITIDQENRRIVIDFGESCINSEGIERKGVVTLEYSGNFLFPGATVLTTFEGYEVDGLQIEGTRSIVNSGVDLANNQINLAVTVENGVITWPDGSSATYESDQIREVRLGSEGYEINITGTASGTSRTGISYTSLVETALEVNQPCVESGVWIPSAGVLVFNYENSTVSADFGTGDCDRTLILTYPGGSQEITVD